MPSSQYLDLGLALDILLFFKEISSLNFVAA